MSNYDIRLAKYEDIPGIMDFIGTYWKPGHILAVNREFFEYQYVYGERNVGFALAVDASSSEILCVCGFHSSCAEVSKGSAWGSIWVKKPDAPRGLGAQVHDFVIAQCGAPHYFAVGLRLATVQFYHSRGFLVDKMRHYYRLSSAKKSYNVASITDRQIPPCDTSVSVRLVPMSEGSEFEMVVANVVQLQPVKDYWYLCRRYINHPVYAYDVWGLERTDGSINSLLVTRAVDTEAGRVLRLIDIIGAHRDLRFIGTEIDRLLFERDCEYADIYCYGVKEEHILQMGFTRRAENDRNIIPNYFEPFMRENIDITFASTQKEGFCIFKGDADQDRPSITPVT